MKIDNREIEKIFDFILVNKNIKLSDDGIFNRDFLIMLRDIIKDERQNNFELSKEQEAELINSFLRGNSAFDSYTPSFITSNLECINAAIERDFNSADYVDWASLSKEDRHFLIEKTIKSGYVLSEKSCSILRKNINVVLNSISRDIKTLIYASSNAKNNPQVFKYLLLKNYKFDIGELKKQQLSCYADADVMKYALKRLGILDEERPMLVNIFLKNPGDINKYIERYSSLFANALKNVPKISNFKGLFDYSAEFEWEEYKEENQEDYVNIFGKICVELQANDDYVDALDNLGFLEEMETTLGSKYNLLVKAMEDYHTIIHDNQKLENIDFVRDQIAKLSALYISISKENFKKDEIDEYNEFIGDYFIPRKNNPLVYKKTIERKQKSAFEELYRKKDKDICQFLDDVVKKYSEDTDKSILWMMVKYFVLDGYSKLDSFIKPHKGFDDYKRYIEASKLVNRLNSNYIKYTDLELASYLDIIKYSVDSEKYCYTGPKFSKEQVDSCEKYINLQRIFEKVKKQIIFKAKTLDVDKNVTNDELMTISQELPFTDEYFEFNKYYFENNFNFGSFVSNCIVTDDLIEPESLLNDEVYRALNNYIVDNGLIWVLLMLDLKGEYDLGDNFDKLSLISTMDLMQDIVRLAKKFNYDLNKYSDICLLENLCQCADDETIAILGQEVIEKMCTNQSYTDSDLEKMLGIAKELMSQMAKRDKSTVPYVKGKTLNYQYSIYDPHDEEILLSGIKTDACFKVNGTDNDFLHYCALDKNGIIIKITDNFGDFIARASGFRNGNSVYINQLRTVYDVGGLGYEGLYKKEKAEIVETFKKACIDIVETSQQNRNERDKIDFVFATKSYALAGVKSNVSYEVEEKIGDKPMVSNSEDWKNFVSNTRNLSNCSLENGFTMDYDNYSLICMASSKENSIFGQRGIRPKDIKPKDVDALYARKRNDIIATNKPDSNVLSKINRINGLYTYLNRKRFNPILNLEKSTIFVGDNWYIIYSNGVITNSRVLDFDKKAKIEYEATKEVIQKYVLDNQGINIEEISQKLQENCYVKKLNY